MTTTTHAQGGRRRLRATLVGLGLDPTDGPRRIITGEQCLVVGGSEDTHADLLETILRLESELDRLGVGLAEVPPAELADIAWRIDSAELLEIALRLDDGLEDRGRAFEDASAEELTELCAPREVA